MLSKEKLIVVFALASLTFACGPATNQTAPGYAGVQANQSSVLAGSINGSWNVTSIQCGGRSVLSQQIMYYFNNYNGTQTSSSGGQISLVLNYPSANQITMQQASSYGAGYGTGYTSGYGTSTGVGPLYTYNVSGLNATGTAAVAGSTMILNDVNQTVCQSYYSTGNAVISMVKIQ
jgi:hypothetical protein